MSNTGAPQPEHTACLATVRPPPSQHLLRTNKPDLPRNRRPTPHNPNRPLLIELFTHRMHKPQRPHHRLTNIPLQSRIRTQLQLTRKQKPLTIRHVKPPVNKPDIETPKNAPDPNSDRTRHPRSAPAPRRPATQILRHGTPVTCRKTWLVQAKNVWCVAVLAGL